MAFIGVSENGGQKRGRSLGEYSESYQQKLKCQRADKCDLSLSWLQLVFVPKTLELINNKTGETEGIQELNQLWNIKPTPNSTLV